MIWLQGLLVGAVLLLLFANLDSTQLNVVDFVFLVLILAGLILFFLPKSWFHLAGFDIVLVLYNVLLLALAIGRTDQETSEFYLFFFLVLIMAAASQNLIVLMVGVAAIAAVYGAMIFPLQTDALDAALVLRIPFLVVVGLFFGYLVYLNQKESAQRKIASEFTVDLFEYAKTLAAIQDLEKLQRRAPELMRSIMKVDACELLRVESGRVISRYFQNSVKQELPLLPIERSIHGDAYSSNLLIEVTDFSRNGRFVECDDFKFYRFESYLATSWSIPAHGSGVIALYRRRPIPWSDQDRQRLRFLEGQTVLAMQNTYLLHELETEARTDGLTGVANYRYFRERLQEEFSRAGRRDQTFTVMLVDIDKMKEINDSYGHRTGDEVLRRTAELFRRTTRRMDIVARVGGDEFSLLLPDTGTPQARELAQRILSGVASIKLGDLNSVTISIGSATFPDDASETEALIENADQALYRAKAEGRSTAFHYSDL